MEIERETFAPDELDRCLSHYDIGKVKSTREFLRGSRRSPKMVIVTKCGKFLFKRRAHGRDDQAKVSFTHEIQRTLAGHDFPLPAMIATKEGSTMLVLDGNVYEMFEFVSGRSYDSSVQATYHAGRTLGQYHMFLKGFSSSYQPPQGSYHNAESIHQAIRHTVCSLPLEGRPSADELTASVNFLESTYKDCAAQAEALGLLEWDRQIVHGDWHPGNMLFGDRHVVAVIDYDAARLQQRAIDLANGALQFSIIGGGSGDPANWPNTSTRPRYQAFIRGYDSVNANPAGRTEGHPLPDVRGHDRRGRPAHRRHRQLRPDQGLPLPPDDPPQGQVDPRPPGPTPKRDPDGAKKVVCITSLTPYIRIVFLKNRNRGERNRQAGFQQEPAPAEFWREFRACSARISAVDALAVDPWMIG